MSILPPQRSNLRKYKSRSKQVFEKTWRRNTASHPAKLLQENQQPHGLDMEYH